MRKRILLKFFVLLFLALFFITACSDDEGDQGGETIIANEAWVPPTSTAWSALALLRTGENPLWFELGPDGPSHIESPSVATLTPYTPWPHARFIVGMQMWEGFLVMAVNREGFIILGAGSEPTELFLYRVANSAFWDLYTAESFFIWEDRPSVLLYRNDFFSAPAAAPLPSQVFALSKSSPFPVPVSIGAFESFPSPWEAEVVRRGPSGFWYFRMKEKGQGQNVTAYFRTEDLSVQGVRISVEEWRNSDPRGFETPGANVDSAPFSLPALPEGFVYSGVVLLGNVLAASWEEQRDASIGAAGFMVMALNTEG